jgi:hypothetical protein
MENLSRSQGEAAQHQLSRRQVGIMRPSQSLTSFFKKQFERRVFFLRLLFVGVVFDKHRVKRIHANEILFERKPWDARRFLLVLPPIKSDFEQQFSVVLSFFSFLSSFAVHELNDGVDDGSRKTQRGTYNKCSLRRHICVTPILMFT